jgi:nitrate reductase NapE component
MTYSVYLGIYVLLVFCFLYLAIQWLKRKRRPRLPFKPERDKLLRGPGESLKQKIEVMDENIIFLLVALMLLPLLAGFGVLAWMQASQLGTPGLRMAAALGSSILILVAGALYLASEAIKRGNYHLGWFGERLIAEELEPLRESGWKIFHDVPAERGKHEFNIDHVAVGPGGVFSIETKMRRAGQSRTGRRDRELQYDGHVLSWPWADDTHGLKQAADSGRWLRDWLVLMTGERIEVAPVLVFPGYSVVPPDERHPVSVVNAGSLSNFVGDRNDVLTQQQIELLSRQLESRCRDVAY